MFGNDNPEFLAQAVKTDESLEGPEAGSKMLLSIFNDGDETEIILSQENVDEKFFELMCEFLYGRAKMNMMSSDNEVEDLHVEAMKKVVNVVNTMPLDQFNQDDARQMLNQSRGRIMED